MREDSDLAAAIDAAVSVDEVRGLIDRVTAALGFDYYIYGFRLPWPLDSPTQIILTSYPPAWLRRYDEQRYLAIDPVLLRGQMSVVPFTWDELDRSDPRAAQLFREAAEHGLRCGLSAAVHGAHGEAGLLSVARAAPLPTDASQRWQLMQRTQGFTALLHQRLRTLALAALGPLRRQLTPRERDCLTRAAEGHSAAQIAQDLKIAERTVVFHLNRAEEKLGVRRRQQAVARAVVLGEITPAVYPPTYNSSQLVRDPAGKGD